MGFISNLGKGFIRSAVNQVGRDGGKIISNKLYENAHATPIRNVNISSTNTYFDEITQEEITAEQLRERAILEGFTTTFHKHSTFSKVIFCIFCVLWFMIMSDLSAIVAYLPIAYFIAKGVVKITGCRKMEMRKSRSVALYKSDRRYKTGQRMIGHTTEIVKFKVPASEEEASKKRKIGYIYLVISCLITLLAINMADKYNKYTKEQEKIEAQREEKLKAEQDSLTKTYFPD